jgi:hypothetical protein
VQNQKYSKEKRRRKRKEKRYFKKYKKEREGKRVILYLIARDSCLRIIYFFKNFIRVGKSKLDIIKYSLKFNFNFK